MDNNYLYIVGFLGILLVTFVVFYYFQKRKGKETNNKQMNQSNNQEEDNVECDGDKCFIKSKPKYDKCDDGN